MGCRNSSLGILNLQNKWYYTVIYSVQYLRVGFSKMQKTSGGGFLSKVRTSLHSGPMLKVDCPISHKLLGPATPNSSLRHTYLHMWHNFKLAEDDIGTLDVFLIRHSYFFSLYRILNIFVVEKSISFLSAFLQSKSSWFFEKILVLLPLK
jgi:hypothetical protein